MKRYLSTTWSALHKISTEKGNNKNFWWHIPVGIYFEAKKRRRKIYLSWAVLPHKNVYEFECIYKLGPNFFINFDFIRTIIQSTKKRSVRMYLIGINSATFHKRNEEERTEVWVRKSKNEIWNMRRREVRVSVRL